MQLCGYMMVVEMWVWAELLMHPAEVSASTLSMNTNIQNTFNFYGI